MARTSRSISSGTFTSAGSDALAGDSVSLAMLDFNGSNAFSNPRVLYTPPAGTSVTLSSFFPNSAGIVFEVELSNPSGNFGYTWNGNTAELWGSTWPAAAASPRRAKRLRCRRVTSISPLTASRQWGFCTPAQALDATLNFEATVNPIASGGYAWVVFTSRRMYGNVAQLAPWASDPRDYPWLDQVTDKKMWVAAVDMNAKPGTDPSHPAFYLPAQELHAGNSRGYWTVELCHADGQGCTVGDQCCGGFCEPGTTGGGLACTSVPPECSGLYEKCASASDCCGQSSGIECVNGICTQPGPPKPK